MSTFNSYEKANFGDKRLSVRLVRILDQLSGNPSASISAACGDPHQAKAVYRFIGNDEVSAEALFDIITNVTVTNILRASPAIVLIIEDTTDFNFTNLKATDGLGSIGGSIILKGLFAHSALAVSEMGEVFGLMSQHIWSRPHETFGLKKDRANIPIEDKESYRWLDGMIKSEGSLPKGRKVVYVCDREGDIYELFCKAEELGTNYLVRKQYDRMIEEEGGCKRLGEFTTSLPEAGRIKVKVPRDSHTGRKMRDAELTVKYGKCQLPKPLNLAQNTSLPGTIGVYVVSLVEEVPPDGVEGISWQLNTNVPVESFEDAVSVFQWYVQRWKVETFHRVLKSGCKVEELQPDSAEKLKKLIAIYSIIALQIMHLTQAARVCPDETCENYFTEEEWKILYRAAKKTKTVPSVAPTIQEAVMLIAKLGGFLGRKSDGFPGVTVIWRGLTCLYTILDVAAYLMA